MKKTYIIPSITLCTVSTTYIVAASTPTMSFDGDSGTGELQDTGASGAAMAKGSGYNVWNDDWSE